MLGLVRGLGFVEACSAIALFFIAMPLKYAADMPKAVSYVGTAHGFLWALYLIVILAAVFAEKLTWKWFGILFAMSIVPFGPFLVDGRLKTMDVRTPSPN